MKLPLLLLAMLLPFSAPRVQESRYAQCLNGDKRGLIMDGYDPVSYFPEGGGKPKKGDKKLAVTYRKGVYRFSSAKNRDLFLAHPSRFAPAYGGWCAYAMAKDKLVGISPKSYLIVDETLMLYFDSFFDDTRKHWLKAGEDELLPKADTSWRRRAGETRTRSVAAYALEDGLALGGYDPVSYHQEGGPRPGKPALTTEDRGATYRFVSAENRLAFLADPDRYEPAFGGWCAMAMAAGESVPADPTHFLVAADGRLLVFAAADPPHEARWKQDGARKRAEAAKAWRTRLEEAP